MNGIDFLAIPEDNFQKRLNIYREYVYCYKTYLGFHGETLRYSRGVARLEFDKEEDDFNYFCYLCRIRKYEDIDKYFGSTRAFQDWQMESSLGLFC